MRLFRRQRAEEAFEAQRAAVRANPDAAEHLAFQAERGLDRPVSMHPLDLAREACDRFDAEATKLRRRAADVRDNAHRYGNFEAAERKAAKLDARADRYDELVSKLWGKVHPALVDGREYDAPPVCKTPGCGAILDGSREVYEHAGWCEPCYAIATGRAKPTPPDPDTAYVEQLLARLP